MEQSPRIEFGIGCFHFGYHPKAGQPITGHEYVIALETALRDIANIEEFEVDADDSFRSLKLDPPERTCALDEEMHFFPGPQSGLRVRMRLFIPARIQIELGRTHTRRETCERFLVHIIYPFHFPITVVRVIEPSADFEPSDGVFLVWKFLEGCDSLKNDKTIRFEFLGPSPFHANFYMTPTDDALNTTISCRREAKVGYDSYYLGLAESFFSDPEEAFEEFLFQFDGQIGLFYQIIFFRVMRDQKWADHYTRIQEIIERSRRKGARAWWRNTFRCADLIHQAMVELAQIEVFDVDTKYQLRKELQELYIGDHALELLPQLERAMADFSNIPFTQMKEVLQLLDQRWASRLNVVMMALSAVLGGVAGAWVSFVLKM